MNDSEKIKEYARRADQEEIERVKKIRFCWHCSRKLRGNHQAIEKIDWKWRSLHKDCVAAAKDGAEV